jgi:hypothetical protein
VDEVECRLWDNSIGGMRDSKTNVTLTYWRNQNYLFGLL